MQLRWPARRNGVGLLRQLSRRSAAVTAAAGLTILAAAACTSATNAAGGGTSAPTAAGGGTSARSASNGAASNSPTTSLSLTFVTPSLPAGGKTFFEDSGNGNRNLAPIPGTGSLEVLYSCKTGRMDISRAPDIGASFDCIGGPSLITFGKTSLKNNNPVQLRMDSSSHWDVQLLLR